jgi:ABC-type Fe3+ transport system permease subunit
MIARQLRAVLAERCLQARRAAWVLLLAPYLMPMLITGYAYASFSLSLIHHPNLNALFYSVLVCLKFTPIAALILHFTPSAISAEAVYCHRLQRRNASPTTIHGKENGLTSRSKLDEWRLLIHAGCARGPLAAFAIVFLCAFAEFEMASLMWVKTWTVSLFDAHAGGLALSESLRRMVGPLLCEAAAVAIAAVVLGRNRPVPARQAIESGTKNLFAWSYLSVAFTFVLAIPAGMVLWGTVRGFNVLLEDIRQRNFVLSREIIASLLFASGATLLASLIVFGLSLMARNQRTGSVFARSILGIAVCLGLFGPLVLSLMVLASVQLPRLISLRDTPVPLVFTLGLVLLPMAFVLKRVLELTGYRSGLHLARLMAQSRSARDLIWRLSTSGKFWSLMLLFVWAYWDLTASAILAPIGMTPATVRLYNLMHYGQIAALSAMTCATFSAPVLIFLLAWGTRRWWAPR